MGAHARARGTLNVMPRAMKVLLILACTSALVFAPSASANVLKGFWGPTHQPGGASAFPIYHDLGVNVFQQQLVWSNIAPTRPLNARNPRDPAYQWPPDVSYGLAQARAHHIQGALMILFSPPWASGHTTGGRWAPKKPGDFANFAYAASKKYPGVHLWMVWGEPNRVNTVQSPQDRRSARDGRRHRAAPLGFR